MQHHSLEISALQDAAYQGRFDLYASIHKALRAYLAHTLQRVGNMDCSEDASVRQTCAEVDALASFCSQHLQHENDMVHPVLERLQSGSSGQITAEHEEHVQAIAALQLLVARLRDAAPTDRAALAHRLYLQLSRFMAHNLEHMWVEETHHNQVLWSHYGDADLLELHHYIVGSLSPEHTAEVMHWMIPASSPAERVGILQDIRQNAPADAFGAIMQLARARLNDSEWQHLARALGHPVVPGLTEV